MQIMYVKSRDYFSSGFIYHHPIIHFHFHWLVVRLVFNYHIYFSNRYLYHQICDHGISFHKRTDMSLNLVCSEARGIIFGIAPEALSLLLCNLIWKSGSVQCHLTMNIQSLNSSRHCLLLPTKPFQGHNSSCRCPGLVIADVTLFQLSGV